jgi:hypothetical protein
MVMDERPEFKMFRNTPKDVYMSPPLASSLQSFESSVELIALARYPHAFTTIVFAIESALKAGYKIGSRGGVPFRKLLENARNDLPEVAQHSEHGTTDLRQTRNRIVHYGYSPKDDRITATILLEYGIPLLASIYAGFFKFDLYDGLIVEFGEQLMHALEVYDRFRGQEDIDPSLCFLAFAHQVRWSMKARFMAGWEIDVADRADVSSLKFEIVQVNRTSIENALDPSYEFDCPVCSGINSFICQLESAALDSKLISLSRCVCIDCGLSIPRDARGLADTVLSKQVGEKKVNILNEYGLS